MINAIVICSRICIKGQDTILQESYRMIFGLQRNYEIDIDHDGERAIFYLSTVSTLLKPQS